MCGWVMRGNKTKAVLAASVIHPTSDTSVESGSREDSRVGNNIVDIKVWR